MNHNKICPIAIYLPQFHSIPENDKAWGKDFTEWTNVKKAKPLFEGHYQPHEPHDDMGYYNLSDPDILVKQAEMAKQYGIYGFAFYHYWFNGKRLLNLPLDNMLALEKPDFPFCFIWANEPWSKRWDGSEDDVIQPQNHSFEDDLNHIRFLCENVFSDKRYIKIDGKPMFIVYRTELFPDIKKTAEIWRNEVKKYGFKDIYLVRVEQFVRYIDPATINFDATMEFAPDIKKWEGNPKFNKSDLEYTDFSYMKSVADFVVKEYDYNAFRCVFPSWDNSPRKKKDAILFSDSEPGVFSYYVYKIFEYTINHFPEDRQFVFINAWNEWGEGCHIEPDKKNGYDNLLAIRNGLSAIPPQIPEAYCTFLEKDRAVLLDKLTILEKYKRGFYLIKNKIGRFIPPPIKKYLS